MEASRLLLLGLRAASSAASVNNGSYPGAFPPPPGVTPNLESPEDAGRVANIAVLIVCDVVVTLLFAVKIWVKIRITKNVLLEDITCTIAWACILLYSATVFVMTKYGEGYHSWDVSPHDYSQMLKWLYASSIIYCPTAYFTKVTLLLLIARVFAIKTGVSRSIYIFIWGLLIAYLPIQAVKIVICNPIRSYWDPSVDGHCLQQRKIFIADLTLAILTDLVILIVPIPLTWRLRMPWKKKLKIVMLLGAGGVATAMTVFRLYKVVEFQKSTDVASDFVLLDLLTILEVSIGVICACLPAANILLEHHFGSQTTRQSLEPFAASPTWEKYRSDQKRKRLQWGGLGTTLMSHDEDPSLMEPGGSPSCSRVTGHHAAADRSLAMTESTTKSTLREGTPPTNFDLELAMLTRDSEDDKDSAAAATASASASASASACPSQHRPPLRTGPSSDDWFNVARATSLDGRREGWLNRRGGDAGDASNDGASARSHRQDEAAACSAAPRDRDREASSTESGPAEVERISTELARVSGNRPWTRIWDGRANTASTTNGPTP